MIYEYSALCPIEYKLSVNRNGAGWENDVSSGCSIDDIPLVKKDTISKVLQSAIANTGDFDKMMRQHVLNAIGGSVKLSSETALEITIRTDRKLSSLEFKALASDLANKLSTDFNAEIGRHEVAKWDDRRFSDYSAKASLNTLRLIIFSNSPRELTPERQSQPGLELATRFFNDVMDNFETVGAIEEQYGQETVVDMFYLQHALMTGYGHSGSIQVDSDSGILAVINELPGKDSYLTFVKVNEPESTFKP